MKIIDYLITITIVAAALFSCAKSNQIVPRSIVDSPVVFGQVGEYATKATKTGWSPQDEIGLFALDNGTTTVVAANREYRVVNPAVGDFTPVGEENKIIFPTDGAKLDFLAYSPYRAAAESGVVAIDVADQSDLGALDLLLSHKVKGRHQEAAEVNLVFKHALSNVIFKVLWGEGTTDESGDVIVDVPEIRLSGISTEGTLNVLDGTITATNGDKTVRANDVAKEEGAKTGLVLIPGNYTAPTIELLFNGKSAALESNLLKSLSGGKKYTVTLSVNITPAEEIAVVIVGGRIEGWDDGGSEYHEVDKPEEPEKPSTPEGEGTEATPYTVEDLALLEAGQMNGVWVGGVVVGSKADYTLTRIEAAADNNIVIGATADTPMEEGVVVELKPNTEGWKQYNLKDNPALKGSSVKVEGDVEGIAGAFVIVGVLTEPIAPEEPEEPADKEETIFHETFAKFEGKVDLNPNEEGYFVDPRFDEQGVAYQGLNFIIRQRVGTYPTSVWIATDKIGSFKIEGIETEGYSDYKLSYSIGADVANKVDVNTLSVYLNGVELEVPSGKITSDKDYMDIELSGDVAPAETLTVEFKKSKRSDANIKLNNIKIVGTR